MTLTTSPAPRRAKSITPQPSTHEHPISSPLHGLNPEQARAVTHDHGVLVIIAGAGSGKTRVIERRTRHLISHGADFNRILLLTFTKRAATEMRERIEEHHPNSGLTATTYHAFAYHALRELQPHLEYPRIPIVIDTDDSARLLNDLARAHTTTRPIPGRTIHTINSARINRGLELHDAITREAPEYRDRTDEIRDLITQYHDLKRERALLDFDDLLTHLERVLKNDALAPLITDRYDHLLVDEFQDVNPIQARITWLLAPHRNITIVGDPSQSIYRFRGARVESLEEALAQQHATIIRLEQNYRSDASILTLANHVLSSMPRQHRLTLRTSTRPGGRAPTASAHESVHDEARAALAWIHERLAIGAALDHLAILYRSSHLNIPLQSLLLRESIPFRTYGGSSLTSTAHVKDVLALLRAVMNPEDALAVRRACTLHPGIGPATARDVSEALTFNAPDDLRAIASSARGGARASLNAFADVIERAWRHPTFPALFNEVLTYYQPLMERAYDRLPQRQRDLDALTEIASAYHDGMQLVTDLTLDTSITERDESDAPQHTPSVTLSTIHAAKGLEWPHVLLYSASDDHLPHWRSLQDDGDHGLNEERRLCYVALTRAQDTLHVSYTTHPNSDHPHDERHFTRFLDTHLTPTTTTRGRRTA